jgi:sec-independent protein translocase protein TatC
MPLLGHLRELRNRLLWCVGALVVGMVVSMLVAKPVINQLTAMCSAPCEIISTKPTEGFVAYFQVGLRLGLVLASPVILYEIAAFVVPALHRHERKYLYLLVPGGTFLFAVGVAFAYFVVLPRTVPFLAGFSDDLGFAPMWTFDLYLALVTNMMVAIGVAFLTPLVVYILSKVGIITPAFMSHYRRYFVVVAAILAAVLTPTPDPFTMFMVLIPMLLLYELGLLMARFL